jgi:hypothetical protein
VRGAVIVGCCAALGLAACSGGKSGSPTTTTTVARVSTTTTAPRVSTTVSAPPSTSATTVVPTTTLPPCPLIPAPKTPAIGPTASNPALLTNVHEAGDRCVDNVIFDFTVNGADPPGYTLTYGTPPFVADASGAPVAVAGNAFVVVKIQPGYSYDFETGRQTYNGPKSIPIAHANHVRAIVETGDSEGVMTWVIGLDVKRPFRFSATARPLHQLVVTVG